MSSATPYNLRNVASAPGRICRRGPDVPCSCANAGRAPRISAGYEAAHRSRRRPRRDALGQHGVDQGSRKRIGELGQHHDPLSVAAGDRRMGTCPPGRGSRHSHHADERMGRLPLAAAFCRRDIGRQRGLPLALGDRCREAHRSTSGRSGDPSADRARPRTRDQAHAYRLAHGDAQPDERSVRRAAACLPRRTPAGADLAVADVRDADAHA
jgi:hypothetical protein